MKMYFLSFLCSFLLLTSNGQNEKKVTLLFTNDLHSHLTGFAPETSYSPMTVGDDNTLGGFARIASIINIEKSSGSGVTIVVDAGDFLMGTLFQSLEVKTGFQLRLMKEMGYDVVCIGNHEFDLGPEKLASIVSNAAKYGEIPPVLLSNAEFDDKDSGDDSLEALFSQNIIGRKFVLTRGGIKIGFFSLMGEVADENAAFAPPVTFSKQIPMARKMVRDLQNEKCDLIICLSHSGVEQNKDGKWGGEDAELAKKVKGIDVIISGHTHTKLDEPLIINNIPIVQAGEYGKFVGKLSLTKSKNIKVNEYELIPVNDNIAGDERVHQLIEKQKELISNQVLEPLGMEYNKSIVESAFLMECNEYGDVEESNLGPFIADAIQNYVNNHVSSGTDFSMVAVGVIRDKIVPGMQTAPDVFRIMSMGSGKDEVPGYPLSRLYVTGKELKSILEILLVASKSTPANHCYYSGLRVEYDPVKGLLKKISRIEIIRPGGENKLVDFSKKNNALYSVTANSYMLEFIGIIKKMSFGLINVVPKDSLGNPVTNMQTAIIDMDGNETGIQEGKEWLALVEYLTSMKDINGNGIPDIDNKYTGPVKSFFQVKTR